MYTSGVALLRVSKESSNDKGFDVGDFLPSELTLIPKPFSEWLCMAGGLRAKAPGSPVLALLGLINSLSGVWLVRYSHLHTCVHT